MAGYTDDTSKEYWDSVRGIAAAAHALPEDERNDYIHESVDGSYWVIYTHAARKTLEFSPNEHALFEEMGAQTVEDFSTLFTRGAYFAMVQDVHECLQELPEEEDEEEA